MTVIVSNYDDGNYVEEGYSANYYSTLISHLNFLTKRIHINSGIRSYHPTDELYPEVRNIIAKDISLQYTKPPMDSQGNEPTGVDFNGNPTFTPRRAVFLNGWRVKLADESQEFQVLGEQITDDGKKGSGCMDLVDFSPGVIIAIEYAPPSSELIQVGATTDTSNNGLLLEVVPSVFIAQ